jgi:hypothetical protein
VQLSTVRVQGVGFEVASSSGEVFDDLDELVDAIALPAGELDELAGSLDDGPALRRPGD